MAKPQKGSYILLVGLDTEKSIFIGSLGYIIFPEAYYAYVGSAMNGLSARLARHLRAEKKLHWHIDYLLKKSEIDEIIICQSEERLECYLAQALAGTFTAIPDFGSSDCKCRSHLFFANEKSRLKVKVAEAVSQIGLICEVFSRPFNIDRISDRTFSDS